MNIKHFGIVHERDGRVMIENFHFDGPIPGGMDANEAMYRCVAARLLEMADEIKASGPHWALDVPIR